MTISITGCSPVQTGHFVFLGENNRVRKLVKRVPGIHPSGGAVAEPWLQPKRTAINHDTGEEEEK